MRISSIMLFSTTSSISITVVAAVAASSLLYQDIPVVASVVEVELDLQGEQKQQQEEVAVDESHHPTNANEYDDDVVLCGVWLAPSTIEGAGLGMFAGTDYQTGEELIPGGDSVIAIVDLSHHNHFSRDLYGPFLWDEYTWMASALKMGSEGYSEINVASAGFGAAVNCILPIYNVNEWFPVLTDLQLHRSKDAGAGAMTAFHQRKSTARRPISAGEEIFVSYGADWFISRPHFGPVPLEDDLNFASKLLNKYTLLQEMLKRNNASDAIAAEVWTTFVKNTVFNESRVLMGAFRHDDNELEILQNHYSGNLTAARIENSRRDLNWLRQRGTCGDHIVAGPSQLAQAGWGGLAKRTLPAGTVVAQLPMIHIPNRSRLDMYELHQDADGNWVPVNDVVVGQQLLLNYCMGHAESTLLLCPYGPMTNYINHNQTAANVRLQWGRAETGNHMPELLNATVHDIQESDARAKLAMELIAIREIRQGEEILMDYGDEWEAAWKAHVANWKPADDYYISAAQLNADTTSRLRTVFEELQDKTNPDNVELQCDTAFHTDATKCKHQHEAGTLEAYLLENEAPWWPCSVLRYRTGETGDFLYTVHLYQKNTDGSLYNNFVVTDIPRVGFHWVDRPYTSDAYLPNAFRHDIRIPDAMFPEAWRNLRSQE